MTLGSLPADAPRPMPILRGSVTLSRFRVEPHGGETPDWSRALPKGLTGHAFVPLDRDGPDDRTAGFCELEDRDAVDFSPNSVWYGEHALFCWRIDEIRIPASVVKSELETWAKTFEKENARKPGRNEKNEARTMIRQSWRSRAPIIVRTFDVSWNVEARLLQIWAGSRKAVDEVQAAVEQAFAVRLVQLVPSVVADSLGIADKALVPTPALSLPDEGRTA